MKDLLHILLIACAVALLPACSDDDAPASGGEGTVIHLRVSNLTMAPVSRASEPMSSDLEKYVKSIAIFQFDNEGLHINSASTYHFIDFIKGTVDGVKGVGEVHETEFGIVETELKGLQFEDYTNGTLCFVANVTEAQVGEFYEEYREAEQSYGRITLDRFKDWLLPFVYKNPPEGVAYDETVTGHLEIMYMFGYYQGGIDTSRPEDIWVDLGRLASRIDITVINETGQDITKRLGYHFDNVCRSAYVFPSKKSEIPVFGAGLSRTIICTGPDELIEGVPLTFPNEGKHTSYFYIAAYSATSLENATKMHLIHGAPVLSTDSPVAGGSDIKVPLCNVHPSQAADVPNGYSLSRNTRYNFTIRLKARASQAVSRSTEYDENNGDIIVYLP